MRPNNLDVGGVGMAGTEEDDDLQLLDDLQELLGGSQGEAASPVPPSPAPIQLPGPTPVPLISSTHTGTGPQPASLAAVGTTTMAAAAAAAMAAKTAAAGQAPPASATPVQSAFASAQGSMAIGTLADVLPPVQWYSQQPGAGAVQQPGQRQQPQQLPMQTQQQQQPEPQQGHMDRRSGGNTISSASHAAAGVASLPIAAPVAPVCQWLLTAEGSGRLYSQGSSMAPGAGAAVHGVVRTCDGSTAVPPHEAALQAAVEAEQALLLGDTWVRPPEPAKVRVWWNEVCGTYGLTWNMHAQCQLSKAELRYLFNGLEVGVGLPEPARQSQSLQPTCPGHKNTGVPPVVTRA